MEIASAFYDIGTAGEMHHDPSRNVLYVAESVEAIARRIGRDAKETRQLLDAAKGKMRAARASRPAPFVDRTCYASWNAMMASALLRAGAVLDDAWAREHALRTMSRLRRETGETNLVAHTPGGVTNLLDDQVQVSAAALDAFEATGDPSWLAWAVLLMQRVWADFADPGGGGLFDTASASERAQGLLPARAKPVQDTPTPSPNGVAGIVCARLHELTGERSWRERGEALLRAFGGRPEDLGVHSAAYLLAVDWHVNPATHLVIVGDTGDETADAMHAAALAGFAPRQIIRRLRADAARDRLPAPLAAMIETGVSPRGYACSGTSCSSPAGDLQTWRDTLAALPAAVPM
jgi:hypothetical protein